MLISPDTQRRFPIQQIPYLDRSLDDVFEDMMAYKRLNCPQWTDESSSDLGIQLLWLYSVEGDFLIRHMERILDNSFLGTTQSREHARRLCQQIGYELSEAQSASATVTFTCASGHPEFTIAKGTQVSTEVDEEIPPIIFEVATDTLVTVGTDTIDIVCIQGETVTQEVLGSSDASTFQTFELQEKPTLWESEEVEISLENTWVTWTRVNNFAESLSTDTHYKVYVDDTGSYYIMFGDGTNGKIPSRGFNNIRCTYRKGGGTVGNVGSGSIVQLVSSVTYVESVSNISHSSGGTDIETIDHARVYGPSSIRTLDRAVTLEDIEAIAENFSSTKFGGIAKAKAQSVGGIEANVMIIPQSGGYPSTGLKTELQDYLDTRRPICTSIVVADPIYIAIDITVVIYTLPNFTSIEITEAVRSNIVSFISPAYQDPGSGLYIHEFGRDIHLSDLYALIDSTSGVDFCELTLPTENVLVANYQIADIGDLIITVNPASVDTAYIEHKRSVPHTPGKPRRFDR